MRYPSSSTSISAIVVLPFLLALAGIVLGGDSGTSAGGCTSFSINGSSTPVGFFFARHRFYDFRRIDNTFIAPEDTSLNLSNSSVSKFVNDSSWTDDWDISVKQVSDYSTDSTVSLQFSADNVYIRKPTFLFKCSKHRMKRKS